MPPLEERATVWGVGDDWISMPNTIEIDAPTAGDIDGIKLNVRVATKSCGPLYVELNQQSFDYLTAVVIHQIDNGEIHRKRTYASTNEKVHAPAGLSFSYKRIQLVETEWAVSPESKKTKRHTTFMKAVASPNANDDGFLDAHVLTEQSDQSSEAHEEVQIC